MAKAKKLFTIGYEQTPAKAVLDELEHAGVKLLVDVRAVASSRRPGFSKNQLAAGLDERGISYVHLRGLGTPKDGREAARSGKFDVLHRIYAKHLKTPQAKEELDAWAKRLQLWAAGGEPDDLPRVDPAKSKKAPRDVFAYVIHEGKVRAPAGAMELIERVS